jgi:uncharacterized protein
VTPGTFYPLTVPIWPNHYRIVAGHRLRLTVSSDDSPLIETEALPGTVFVELGTSRLDYQAMPGANTIA